MKKTEVPRRTFIKKAGLIGASGLLMPTILKSNSLSENTTIMNRPKVLFFDVNETLLDLTSMKGAVSEVLEGRDDLLPLWFTTMLQYSLVVSASGQYEHFGVIGAAALQMVAKNEGISVDIERAKSVISSEIQSLPPHPEVKEALTSLKDNGYKLVSFTNSSNQGVKAQFEHAGLTHFFDERLSVEDVGKFKPFTETYDWGAKKMGLQPKECMLVAAHGWDVAGALWAGWRAAFIDRPGKQLFPLAPETEIQAPDLKQVADKLIQYQ
ncbi:haloacid dehalogenase type II [Echinicola strongylocentroti]|uniref:Haloacid dehalogenase type II n=1 Tax=Echinicola strongylocentroti TaxID=1795355 RepID=A0A2Z4IPM6_9BACT|nr:haloacid dehalogenase type II [Echinicola strongylocentroti]AWW32754.1 haloacid dehalogenase type II [Echinicola strongylocentroti]